MFIERRLIGIKRLEDMDDVELRHVVGEIRQELGQPEAGEVDAETGELSAVAAELIEPPNG